MTYFKVLNADGSCYHSGVGSWYLPTNKPGEWMPAIKGKLKPCQNGYHILKPSQLINWLGPAVFEVEPKGSILDASDKCLVRTARLLRRFKQWNGRTARLFACDCAEHVLESYERDYPSDNRPRRAIEVARLYARGKATKRQLAAARAAAEGGAAWAAAEGAAKAAGWDAERKWQTELLMNILEVECLD